VEITREQEEKHHWRRPDESLRVAEKQSFKARSLLR
jgi:hypothetical protein